MNTTTQRPLARRRAARSVAALASLAVVGVALAGCVPAPLVAAGPRVTTELEVSDGVHALRLETAGDVTVELGEEPGLTVRAPRSISERLTVDEEDGTLVLGSRGPGVWSARVEYVLTVVSFDELVLEGAGDVTADFSSADEVDIRVDGAGNVRATGVDADEVEVAIGGAGDVRLEGTARSGELTVSGTGSIRASELVLQRAEAEISGAGDIAVHATDALDARISGAGDIRVSGEPRITSDVSGLGDVIEH